ncbi:helix-turn-helix transcriptional regulator [Lentisphaerota bacterium WC36G]|nr:helix-turn-helix transcriptional regulator [Lentisphaerae bacterium WC36]
MNFGLNLSQLMAAYNIKVNSIAQLIGVNQGYISKVRHGKASVSFEQFEKIGETLEKAGATEIELELLCDHFISEKTGIPFKNLQNKKSLNDDITVDEMLLLNNFRKLPDDEKVTIVETVTRKVWQLENK